MTRPRGNHWYLASGGSDAVSTAGVETSDANLKDLIDAAQPSYLSHSRKRVGLSSNPARAGRESRIITEVLRKKIQDVRPPFTYELIRQIGQGQNPVYLAVRRDSGTNVAVKKIRLISNYGFAAWTDTLDDIERCVDQFLVVSSLKHPHIVEHFGLKLDLRDGEVAEIHLVMEYCSGGTLLSKSRSVGGLTEANVRRYTRQIISGLACIHQLGICHLDIKGENLLLTEDDSIKICDFGEIVKLQSATHTRPSEVSAEVGTLRYNAPEMINPDHAQRGRKADIYSFGCVLIEMITGQMPQYKHKTRGYLQDRWLLATFIGTIGGGPEMPLDRSVPQDIDQILRQCLDRQPHMRPSAQQLQQATVRWCEDPSQQNKSDSAENSDAFGSGPTELDSKRLYDFVNDHYTFEKWADSPNRSTDSYNVLVLAPVGFDLAFILNMLFNRDTGADSTFGGFVHGHDTHSLKLNPKTGACEPRRVVVAAIRLISNIRHVASLSLTFPVRSHTVDRTLTATIMDSISQNFNQIDAVFVVLPEDFLDRDMEDIVPTTQKLLEWLGYDQSTKFRFCPIGTCKILFSDIPWDERQKAFSDMFQQIMVGSTMAQQWDQPIFYAQPALVKLAITDSVELEVDQRKMIKETWAGLRQFLRLSDSGRILTKASPTKQMMPGTAAKSSKNNSCSLS